MKETPLLVVVIVVAERKCFEPVVFYLHDRQSFPSLNQNEGNAITVPDVVAEKKYVDTVVVHTY